MDDEQMAALDSQLATIFRERKKQVSDAKLQRQENSKAKENITTLKSRVLDLFEIYVNNQGKNPQCITLLLPCLELMQTTKDTPLGQKARGLIKKICRCSIVMEDPELAFDVLRKTHALAARASSKPLSLACNQVSVYATKLLVNHDQQLIEQVAEINKDSLVKWVLEPKNKSTANLFIDAINFLAQKR